MWHCTELSVGSKNWYIPINTNDTHTKVIQSLTIITEKSNGFNRIERISAHAIASRCACSASWEIFCSASFSRWIYIEEDIADCSSVYFNATKSRSKWILMHFLKHVSIHYVFHINGCIIYLPTGFSHSCCVELVLCSRQTLLVSTVSNIIFFSHLEAQEIHYMLHFWRFYVCALLTTLTIY